MAIAVSPLHDFRRVYCEVNATSFRIVAEYRYNDERGRERPPLVGKWMAKNAKDLATLATPDGQVWRAAGSTHDPQLPVYKPFTLNISPEPHVEVALSDDSPPTA